MFVMGMACVFVGISLLAPDETKGTNTVLFMVYLRLLSDKLILLIKF